MGTVSRSLSVRAQGAPELILTDLQRAITDCVQQFLMELWEIYQISVLLSYLSYHIKTFLSYDIKATLDPGSPICRSCPLPYLVRSK